MITWSEIEAEAGDYRDGFVAIFRKYEGQPTDEKSAQGHPVVVTVRSFAVHMGIAEETFRRWVRRSGSESTIETDSAKQAAYRARSAVRNEPEQVVEAIAALPEAERQEFIKQVARTLPDREHEELREQRNREIYEEDQRHLRDYAEQRERNAGLEIETRIKLDIDRLVRGDHWYHLGRARDYINGIYDSHAAQELTPEMFTK